MEMSKSGEDEVSHLLQAWGLSDLKAKFKANFIVLQALEYLTEEDIVELIPKIGQRAIFRGRLIQWRQQNGLAQVSKALALPPLVPLPSSLQICKVEAQIDKSPAESKPEECAPKSTSPAKLKHKLFGTLTKCIQKPKPLLSVPSICPTSKPAIQSKVQQFYISPIAKSTAQTLPSSSPVISTLPKADLTPFVTSIIRVDTTEPPKTYSKNASTNISSSIPQFKGNRATILQKVKNAERNSSTSSPVPPATADDQKVGKKEVPEDQSSGEEQSAPSHLYPIVKLETEEADTNWNEYSEPEQDQDPIQEPLKIPKKEKEDEVIADSTDFHCVESMESDSAPDFDSDNSGAQADPTVAEPFKPRKKREKKLGKIDIRNVLMNSDMGRHVLMYYETKECLDFGRRRMLIDAIVQYCLISNRRISPRDCREMAKDIIELLPNERIEDYYLAQAGKNPRSPLYNKFRNSQRRFYLEKGMPLQMRKKKKPHLNIDVDEIEVDDSFIIS